MALDINNEMDIMLAHRRGMQFARFSGMSLSEQTRFATAVSEICRNCVEYAFKGHIQYSIWKSGEKHSLLAVIKDEGKGIKNLDEVLSRTTTQYRGRGMGIVLRPSLSPGGMSRQSCRSAAMRCRPQERVPIKWNHLIDKDAA